MPDPHLAYEAKKLGAKIIFHSVNGGRSGSEDDKNVIWPYHESNLIMRARSAAIWIVTVDNAYPIDLPASVPSGILNPKGEWLVKCPEKGEHYFCESITL